MKRCGFMGAVLSGAVLVTGLTGCVAIRDILVTGSDEIEPLVANHPESFYRRDGLRGMPVIDYEAMPVVNVRDLGALGDGRQPVNDIFTRAVRQLAARGGGVVYIPEGEYVFEPCVPPQRKYWSMNPVFDEMGAEAPHDIHFVGEGEKTVIRFSLPVDAVERWGEKIVYGWRLGNSRNVSVRDLSFTWFPYFDQRWGHGKAGYSLAFGGAKDVQVVNVRCDQGAIAICFWAQSEDAWVVDCDVRNTSADAVKFDDNIRATAAYNYIENPNDDSFSIIHMAPRPARSEDNQLLYNTMIGGGGGRGFPVSGDGHRAIGNWIERVSNAGIYGHTATRDREKRGAEFASGDVLIADNTLVRTNLLNREDNVQRGFRLGGAISVKFGWRDLTIRGNRLFGSASKGISFGSGWKWVEAEDVSIADNVVQGNVTYGIGFVLDEDDWMRDVFVEGNLIGDNGNADVLIRGPVADLVAIDNVVSQPVANESTGLQLGRGFREGRVKRLYRDAYRDIRAEASETVWRDVDAPDTAALRTINILQCGAVADGKANTTDAFHRAVQRLPEAGGIIHFPAGTYAFEPVPGGEEFSGTRIRHHAVVAGRRNVHLRGEGDTTVLVFASADHEGVRFINVQTMSVRGLTMRCRDQRPLRHNRALLDISGCRQVHIEDVSVADSSGPGIRVDSSTGVRVENCRSENAGTYGLSLLASRQVRAVHNVVRSARDHGILVDYKGSIFREPQFVDIAGNRVSGSREASGIAVASGDRIRVHDNTVEDAYMAGILIYQYSKHFWPDRVDVTGNALRRCAAGKYNYMRGAVSINRCRQGRFTISENDVRDCPANGVWVYENRKIQRCVISGNSFADVAGDEVHVANSDVDVVRQSTP